MLRLLLQLSLLLVLSSAAIADENFVLDGRQPPPAGSVYALRGEHLDLIRTTPHTTYWATIELFAAGEQVGAVLGTFDAGYSLFLPTSGLSGDTVPDPDAWPDATLMLRVNRHMPAHVGEAILLLRVPGAPPPARITPEQTALLESGRRFSFGEIELLLHTRGYDSVRVRLRSNTTLPPVLDPPAPGDLRQLPRVSHQPEGLTEDLGWFMASLNQYPEE